MEAFNDTTSTLSTSSADDDQELARRLQEEEDAAMMLFKTEQERADLAYAARLADDWQSQRERQIEKLSGTKVCTYRVHETKLHVDDGDDEDVDEDSDEEEEEVAVEGVINGKVYVYIDNKGRPRLPGRDKNNPQPPALPRKQKQRITSNTTSLGKARRVGGHTIIE